MNSPNISSLKAKRNTTLRNAALNGDTVTCKSLLKLEFENNNLGQTALHVAATYGHLDICKLLIETDRKKDRTDQKDRKGRTALDLAIDQKRDSVTKLLS